MEPEGLRRVALMTRAGVEHAAEAMKLLNAKRPQKELPAP
jgi:hypothetical protein